MYLEYTGGEKIDGSTSHFFASNRPQGLTQSKPKADPDHTPSRPRTEKTFQKQTLSKHEADPESAFGVSMLW